MKRLVNLMNVVVLDNLIRTEVTGSPEELAKKLNISRTNFFDTISFLREEMQAPIIYDVKAKMYKYSFIPKFYLNQEVKSLLSGESDADIVNNDNNVFNIDSEEDDIDDEAFNEKLKSKELLEVYGGLEKDDWMADSFNDDLNDVKLDINTNFNDLFIEIY